MWFYFFIFLEYPRWKLVFPTREDIQSQNVVWVPQGNVSQILWFAFDEYMDNSVLNSERHPYGLMEAVRRTMNMWSEAIIN